MELVKILFNEYTNGGTQLNKDGIMKLLSEIYDIFEMEQFEMVSFKSRGETIKEWWDELDNVEVLSWDHFEKKGKQIVESLPASKDNTIEKDASGQFKLVSKSNARKRISSGPRSLSLGKGKKAVDATMALEDRTLIPTGEIVKLFSPYLEKVWELYLAFKEPTEDTLRPYFAHLPLVLIWINNIIAAKGRVIADVQDGFMDGLALISLIEVLSGTDLKGYVPQPANHVEMYKNITLALKFATHLKIDIHPVTPDDVHYGKIEKLLVLFVRMGEKWHSAVIEDRKGKVSSSPLVNSESVELKVDQKEQDEIYRLSSIAQQTKRPAKRVFKVVEEDKSAAKKKVYDANSFVVDMGALGVEEIPYQQTRQLGEVLQELCNKHNIQDINSYIATTSEGSELFLDSMLGEIPKMISFVPAQTDSKGTLADLIKASDKKAKQKRLTQVVVAQRNYDAEDEDEMASRKRQLQRANAFDKAIDESVSNIALEGMRKEYEKLMVEKIREQQQKRKKQAQKPAPKIQSVDLEGLNKMVGALNGFQKSYGTSEVANDFFSGLL